MFCSGNQCLLESSLDSSGMILMKSIMPSFPVYAISLFKAPSDIISSIDSILCCFF